MLPTNNPIGAEKHAPSCQVKSPAAAVRDKVIVARLQGVTTAERAVIK
jgi:hypothetical protein